MNTLKSILAYRACKLLYGIEEILQAIICEATVTTWRGSRPITQGPPFVIDFYVRWWHPAAWVGWIRVNLLHDRVCSSFYGRKKS